jgi:hypothetical protein
MPTATPFSNLITFSRGSNATVTGSNGLIQWAPSNFITFSEQFDNAAWTKSGTAVSANVTTSPDGSITADKVIETATSGAHQLYTNPITISAGSTYTYTVYAKQAERNWIAISAWDTSERFTFFNLASGVVGTNAVGNSASITPVGNGWYRCTVTRTVSSGSTYGQYFISTNDNVVTYTGDGTSGAFIWGAQLELGSTATTYNPTTVKNLANASEAFDGASWSKNNSSIVTGAQANPVNGLFNAQKLMENTATNTHQVQQGIPTLVGTPYTASVYVKAAERTWVAVQMQSGTFAYVNLATGAVGNTSGSPTVSVISAGSGWWRIGVTGTAAAASSTFAIYAASANGSVSYTGDGNSGVYIYGAQLSDSASLDPYVPTPGAAPSSTAYYGPRFDYDPVTLLPRGLLVEEQRTNLLLNSVFGGAVSGTPGTAPTSWGSFTNGSIVVTSLGRNFAANSIRITTTSARHFYSQTVALAATGTWIITFKVNVGTAVRIDELLAFNTRPAGSTIQYFYNDAAQVASYVPPTGSGVLQVTVTTTGTSGNAEIRFGCGASNAVTADVTFWDAQWELGTFATSYIPTVASTVTRSADVATITGQNFAQWYTGAQGTLAVEFSPGGINTVSSSLATVSDGTSNNILIPFVNAGGVSFVTVISGGVTSASLNTGAVTVGAIAKHVSAYQADNFAATLNGAAPAVDTSGAVPLNGSTMNIGWAAPYGGLYLNGRIRNIRFIPARAADFQLQALST